MQITTLATGLQHPRSLYVLPNGDILVAESKAPGTEPIKRPKDSIMKWVESWATSGGDTAKATASPFCTMPETASRPCKAYSSIYYGQHVDPRLQPQRPDLVAKAIPPDYALSSHVAPLGLAFYTGDALPAAYRGGAFIGEHGSWNRPQINGYKVVFVPLPMAIRTARPRMSSRDS